MDMGPMGKSRPKTEQQYCSQLVLYIKEKTSLKTEVIPTLRVKVLLHLLQTKAVGIKLGSW